MAKRLLVKPDGGRYNWDATIDDDLDVLGADGLPMSEPEQGTPASLPSASAHDRSGIWVNHAEVGWKRFGCDGTAFLLQGPVFAYTFGGGNTGAQTSLTVKYGGLDFSGGSGAYLVAPLPIKLFYCGVDFRHNNGSDPGDWTLTFTNVDTSVSRTFACELNAASSTHQMTKGKLSAVLSLAAGQNLSVTMTGPSTTAPQFSAIVLASVDVAAVLT